MNINLHNYESFLLMYVDGELSATERLSVQQFILQYPHLNAELQLLQDLVLPAEEGIGFDKNALYRNTEEENIQAAMLLLIDDELPLGESNQLLQNMASNEKMQESFSLLKKAKLDPLEVLAFPQKEMLYKREDRKIFYVRFAKWAVAAALVGLASVLGISVINEKHPKKLVSAKNAERKIIDVGLVLKENNIGVAPINGKGNVPLSNEVIPQEMPKANGSNPSRFNRKINEQASAGESDLAQKNKNGIVPKVFSGFPRKNEIANTGKPTESLRILANNGNLNQNQIKARELNVETATMALVPKETRGESKADIIDVELNSKQNQYANTSSLHLEEAQNDNHVFMIREQDLSRSKAGILFKRIKRTISRNMNSDSGLKIAGFEFAAQ